MEYCNDWFSIILALGHDIHFPQLVALIYIWTQTISYNNYLQLYPTLPMRLIVCDSFKTTK